MVSDDVDCLSEVSADEDGDTAIQVWESENAVTYTKAEEKIYKKKSKGLVCKL